MNKPIVKVATIMMTLVVIATMSQHIPQQISAWIDPEPDPRSEKAPIAISGDKEHRIQTVK